METAIKNVQKFDPTRLPRPWLLGVAANKVKEWGRDRLRDRNKVTPLALEAIAEGRYDDAYKVYKAEILSLRISVALQD